MKFFSALIISQFILAEIEGRPLNILGPNLSFRRVSLAPKTGSPLAEGGAGASAVVLQTWQGQSKGEMADRSQLVGLSPGGEESGEGNRVSSLLPPPPTGITAHSPSSGWGSAPDRCASGEHSISTD